jgi:tetratricopeptide (TPR) repeat protein
MAQGQYSRLKKTRILPGSSRGESICWIAYREDQADRFFPLSIMRNKARVLTILGEWERAEEIYRLIMATMRQSGDKKQEAESLYNLSALLYHRSRYRESQELAAAAESIYKYIGDIQGSVKVLGMMGDVHNAWADYRKALEYDQQMERLAAANGYHYLTADAQRKIGISYFWLGDTERALEYLEKSRQLAEQLHNSQFLGGIIHAIGLTYRERKDFLRARPFLEEAMRIFSRTGDLRSIEMALGSLAGLHYYLEEYDKALELYGRQMEIAERLGDKYFLACACGDISAIYLDKGMFDQAREMAFRELALAQETGDKLAIGDSHYRLGLLAELQGDDTTAGRHFETAVDFGRQVQSGRFLPDYLVSLAKHQYRTGQLSKAGETVAEAGDMAASFFREDITAQCKVLKLLLSFSASPEISESQLVSLAESQPEVSSGRGDIMQQLWKCTGKEEYRLKALTIYKKLAEGKSCSFYQKAIRELDG